MPRTARVVSHSVWFQIKCALFMQAGLQFTAFILKIGGDGTTLITASMCTSNFLKAEKEQRVQMLTYLEN